MQKSKEMVIMNSEKVTSQLKAVKVKGTNNSVSEVCRVFGKNMRETRKENGFTSEAFGRFIGISTAYVGLIERGERTPSLEVFLKICDFFGVSRDEMLTPRDNSAAINEQVNTQESHTNYIARKRKMIASMLNSFSGDELDHIIKVLKSFMEFCRKK